MNNTAVEGADVSMVLSISTDSGTCLHNGFMDTGELLQ